ncbi:MAG TPA: hypothetical protein VIU37_09960 [Candidatus Limnocylindrales bacterium]
MGAQQLDFWDESDTVLSEQVPGIGRVLTTPGGGWRARWTGTRFGWQFDRAITWTAWTGRRYSGWEPWEPDLPYGVEHVLDRGWAVELVAAFAARLGDDPGWLERRRRLAPVR